jgi:hypothetical protein
VSPLERDRLVQRHFDGETVGREAAVAERLLESDADARALLDSLGVVADSVRFDIDDAVEAEDFSSYWSEIADRLPPGPMTLDPDGDTVVHRASEVLVASRVGWLRRLLRPGLAAAAVTALLAVALLAPLRPPRAPVSFAVEIEQVDSAGPSVVVVEATSDAPAIVSFTETAG